MAGVKTFAWPCDTISKIASVATSKDICEYICDIVMLALFQLHFHKESINRVCHLTASGDACNEIMAYSLILSCCCYTCCLRRKLRRTLNIRVTHSLMYYVLKLSR